MSRYIPNELKDQLHMESNNKCANPGCCIDLTEFHHIDYYSVTGQHKFEDMICLCPTCHEQVHRGDLKIDKNTLVNWKKILHTKRNIDSRSKTMLLMPGSDAHQ